MKQEQACEPTQHEIVRAATRKKRIAGLKGWIGRLERMVEANRQDIAYGLPYEHFLAENMDTLRAARAKLAKVESRGQ